MMVRSIVACFVFSLTVTAQAQWAHESELSIVSVKGNTNTDSTAAKQKTTYNWDVNQVALTGRYLRAETEGTETARAWDLGLRYERALAESFSLYAGVLAEADPFAGFTQRDNLDLGGKYFWFKSDTFNLFNELGYRQITTLAAGEKETTGAGRLYLEASDKLNETVSWKFWAEYVSPFKDNKNYLASSELSVTSVMSSIFSLKVAYLAKYQNTKPLKTLDGVPVEGKRLDGTFTTALVAKF